MISLVSDEDTYRALLARAGRGAEPGPAVPRHGRHIPTCSLQPPGGAGPQGCGQRSFQPQAEPICPSLADVHQYDIGLRSPVPAASQHPLHTLRHTQVLAHDLQPTLAS